ncbi:hypothetical protein QYE76_056932 [Lolium multiflorum]|uniref:CCHC-type domain-containing protein n=1 Tax=Lolium multiflorum TaxID=4521 RepID=A0AAD8T2M6_LOLMU|nr:hypothetical protein QYE76_056932 [Lolium multiflorum]
MKKKSEAATGRTGRKPAACQPVQPDATRMHRRRQQLSDRSGLLRELFRAGRHRSQRSTGPDRSSVCLDQIYSSDAKLVNQKDKDAADLMTWRDFEALRNEMRREFRIEDDELRGEVQEINQKLDATNETVTTMGDQMTDIQRSLQALQLAVENLTNEQQQQDKTLMKYLVVVIVPVVGLHLAAMVVDKMRKMDWKDSRGAAAIAKLQFGDRSLCSGTTGRGSAPEAISINATASIMLRVKTVDEYYMEMEMLMQRGRVRESLEMTMQRFLNGLKLRDVLRELGASRLARPHGAGAIDALRPYSTPPSKPVSNVSNTKKSESAASTSGSSMSTARNRDMVCHTCGGKGHFKRDCPNRKVMIINEDNEYETGDDVDPNAPDDDDYDTDGEDAYPSDARTIVVSQRALNVLPSASTQRCNLFQTKALVGPDKACKVIIDGGSCRNLASKELCTKLKLKYLPHPHPYYIQWLSDNGEMKVNHMVRVEFAIGPYKDCIDFDVVPMTVCHLLLGRPWLYDRSVQHNGRDNTYHLEFKGKKINLQPMSPQ